MSRTEDNGTTAQRILLDSGLQQQLDTEGYVLLDLLNYADIKEFLSVLPEKLSDLPFVRGVHITTEHATAPLRHETSAQLVSMVKPRLVSQFTNVKLLHGNFFIKELSSESNAIGFHRDWSFVNEPAGERSYTLWVALCDITKETGGIGVIPGSHLNVRHLKHAVPKETYRFADEIRDIAEAGPVHWLWPRKGQAILWDHRIVHCSGINTGATPRLCATFAMTHANNRLRILWEEKDGFHWYNVPDDFYHLHNTNDLYAAHRAGKLPEGVSMVSWTEHSEQLPLLNKRAHAHP
jgi:hypothetical protein